MREACYCGRVGEVEDREPVWRDGRTEALRCPASMRLPASRCPKRPSAGRSRGSPKGPERGTDATGRLSSGLAEPRASWEPRPAASRGLIHRRAWKGSSAKST